MRKILVIFGICFVFSFLFSCNTMSQRAMLLEKNWGRSYETARYTQIINPDVVVNQVEDQWLDGVSAKHNYDKYQKSSKKDEAPPQVFNINVGGKK